MNEPKAPFQTLGTHLKYLREQLKESCAEVAGAVELDETQLANIEAGLERPAEEVLLLLISHFEMADHEAVQLWESAGYTGEVPEQLQPKDLQSGKTVVMLLGMDTRTMYTDGIEVSSSPAGINLTFTQIGGQEQPLQVGRFGMSYEQAEQVLRALYHGIETGKHLNQPKQLPPQATDCPHPGHSH